MPQRPHARLVPACPSSPPSQGKAGQTRSEQRKQTAGGERSARMLQLWLCGARASALGRPEQELHTMGPRGSYFRSLSGRKPQSNTPTQLPCGLSESYQIRVTANLIRSPAHRTTAVHEHDLLEPRSPRHLTARCRTVHLVTRTPGPTVPCPPCTAATPSVLRSTPVKRCNTT